MKHTIANLFIHKCAALLLALVCVCCPVRTVLACPTCSEAAAANDPEHEHMVKGYFYSILFMMGVPYTVFSGFCAYMYWEVKKARVRNAAQNFSGNNPNKPLLPSAAVQLALPAEHDDAHAPSSHELAEV
jgi:heme/copper-type cytochrome/quinol oxidase subunit 2